MDGEADTTGTLVFGRDSGAATLRERAPGKNVLAVLAESTADEWFRQWQHTGGTASRLGLLECYELTRGSAACANDSVTTSGTLSLSRVERPVDAGTLSSAIENHLEKWSGDPEETLIYVESAGQLGAETGRHPVVELLDWLPVRQDPPQLLVTVDPGTDAAATAVEHQRRLPETIGAPNPDTEALRAVTRLREAEPTTFGYLTRYWRQALLALEATDRAYPRASQLHETVESDLSPRMLGAALSGLVWLDAISLRGETNGPNRYDCQGYDPERVARLGLAADSLAES